jgi:hypothetical protein
MHRRVARVAVLLVTALTWCAQAHAAQVGGSLRVTAVDRTSVSFTVTMGRTCALEEQCDYFSEIDQIDGDGPCPAGHPEDPWIMWTGDVQNTGPTTESATTTPRRWSPTSAIGTSRLCLYAYADLTYSYVDSATITQPPRPATQIAPPGTPGAPGPGAGGGPATPGGAGATAACRRYTSQQSAQKALNRNRELAAALDGDGDGIACEELPRRVTYVRTLARAASEKPARAALQRAYGKAFAQRSRFRSRCERRTRTRVRCSFSWRHDGTWRGYVDVVGVIRRNQQAVVTHVHVIRPG